MVTLPRVPFWYDRQTASQKRKDGALASTRRILLLRKTLLDHSYRSSMYGVRFTKMWQLSETPAMQAK